VTQLETGIYRVMLDGRPPTVLLVDDEGEQYTLDASGILDMDITEMAPLALLDLSGLDTAVVVRALTDAANRSATGPRDARILFDLADQLVAQNVPARIPEPELWGVVADANAHVLGRVGPTPISSMEWMTSAGIRCHWAEIKTPTLIRAGL